MYSNPILMALGPRQFVDEWLFIDEKRILSWFALADAYWGYEGEPLSTKPHAELTSGLCSNGYFDCPRLLSYPNVAEILGRTLALTLKASGVPRVDWVVSSAYSAITFGHEVAKALGARFANVEKDPADPTQRRMLWRGLRFQKVLEYSRWKNSSSPWVRRRKSGGQCSKETTTALNSCQLLGLSYCDPRILRP